MKLTFLTCLVAFTILILSCKKQPVPLPETKTLEVKITDSDVVFFRGSLKHIGDFQILDHGFIYSSDPSLTGINANIISLGKINKDGEFSKTVSNLLLQSAFQGSLLYVRAYINYGEEVVYGEPLKFELPGSTGLSVAPLAARVGESVVIQAGVSADDIKDIKVLFSGKPAPITEIKNGKITVQVPTSITSAHDKPIDIQLQIKEKLLPVTNQFRVQATILDYTPKSGWIGDDIILTGLNLPDYLTAPSVKLLFGNVESISYIPGEQNAVVVPENIKLGKMKVSTLINGAISVLPGEFTLLPAKVTSISATSAYAGTNVSFNGKGLSRVSEYSIKLDNQILETIGVSNTEEQMVIPDNIRPGIYKIRFFSSVGDTVICEKFTVLEPEIESINPKSASFGNIVTIKGTFNEDSNYNITIGSEKMMIASRGPGKNVRFNLPFLPAGEYKIKVDFINRTILSKESITVVNSKISSISPSSGSTGTIVTLKGTGFGHGFYSPGQLFGPKVMFGDKEGKIVAYTETEAQVTLPQGLKSGPVKVTVVTFGGPVIIADTDFSVK